MIELGDVGPDGTAFVEALPADPDEARELLEHTVARLDPKPSRLEYVLDVPHPEKQVLLERLGFELARVTRRWEWRRGTAMPAVEDRLRYRTVERGELEEAIARIAEHSLDRRLDPGEAQRQAALLSASSTSRAGTSWPSRTTAAWSASSPPPASSRGRSSR